MHLRLREVRKNLLALGFGFLVCIVLVLLSELTFGLNIYFLWWTPTFDGQSRLPQTQLRRDLSEEAALLIKDAPAELWNRRQCGTCSGQMDRSGLCYPDQPNQICHSVLKSSTTGEIAHDVHYSLNDFKGRITPRPVISPPKSSIVFLGDSYTFGIGVNDNETFEYYLSQMMPDSEIVNLGSPGSAPNVLLHALEQDSFLGCGNLAGTQKIAIYTFIDFMAERMLAPISAFRPKYEAIYGKMPYYAFDDKGDVVALGTFDSQRPVQNNFYRLIARTNTFDFFKPFIPPISSYDERLMAKVLGKIKLMLMRKCGISRFIVSLYPDTADNLTSALKEAEIEFFDFTKIDRRSILRNQATIVGDGHPTPLTHYFYAALLCRELGGDCR